MSSLSNINIPSSLSNIPRQISRQIIRPNPIQAEREDYERVQITALQKAINAEEVPAKEKHVRTLIIGTFTEKGAHTFWAFVNSRIPVQGNPVVAWKFCYVLHKILRDGHPNSLKDSLRHHAFLVDLGRLWGHLKLGYGPLIPRYCELLAVKIDFHRKNPRFPGNLQITNDELGRIAENDVNNYFQLAVEMFDYMDTVLELSGGIFASFDMSRANSMTSAGQCRLVALIPCILDSCQLYDFIVKMMFRLHTSLPQDVLTGHRDRFFKQFKQLQMIYQNSSNLQFFKNLIQIPSLPDRAPDFFSSLGVSQHVTPVVKVQEPEIDQVDEGFLIDTASTSGMDDSIPNIRDSPPVATPVHNGFGDRFSDNQPSEKDKVIEELLEEVDRVRKTTEKIKSDDLIVIDGLRNRVVELERDMEEQRTQTEVEKNELMRQIEESSKNPQVMANFDELTKRAKSSEEKVKKMKKVYDELTEKHVALLRANGETEKSLKSAKKAKDELERQKDELSKQMLNFDEEKEQLRQSMEGSATDTQRQLQERIIACQDLERKISALEEDLRSADEVRKSAEQSNQEIAGKLAGLQEALVVAEMDLENLNFQHVLNDKTLRRSFLNVICMAAEETIQHSTQLWEHQAFGTITATPEFLLVCIEPASEHVGRLRKCIQNGDEKSYEVPSEIQLTFHHLSNCLVQTIATSHMAPIDLTDEFMLLAKQISDHSSTFLTGFRENQPHLERVLVQIGHNLEVLQQLATALIPKLEDARADEVANLVEKELHDMDKAIEEAALKIEEMLVNARTRDSGIKLEVNAKILDSCTTLMAAIRVLVRKSRALQQEIVVSGKGFASPREFYQKNHRWTEGLISAAKTVGLGANILLEAADKVVTGKGKFEELVVASQEISAGTVQLVVSSKVKADKNSQTLAELSKASKSVTEATGLVVASAKACAQMVEEKADLDFSNLSLHKIKKIEMESQVRLLELESLLTKEREKLSSIRRQHYSMAGTSEGWDDEVAKSKSVTAQLN